MNLMKSILFFFYLFAAVSEIPADNLVPELYNPEVFQVNREPARNTSQTFASVEQAKEGIRQKSPYYRLLNGMWKPHIFKDT